MAKRIKKEPAKPEVRRDWLRRNEEVGESPPQIATKDGYDVRTVRKQIELAKQEREAHEARSLVLRNALERHYDDLRNYAETLNNEILGLRNNRLSLDYDLIGAALRQHLPRSPIWSYLSKWQTLHQKRDQQQQEVERLIEQQVKANSRLTPLASAVMDMVIPGIINALAFQAKQWSQGSTGLNTQGNLLMEPAGEGFVNLRYGAFHMGKMDTEHAERYKNIVRKVLEDLESRIREWEAYRDLEKTFAEIERLKSKLREELAVIRLRRIVPGRCRYCPL